MWLLKQQIVYDYATKNVCNCWLYGEGELIVRFSVEEEKKMEKVKV